MKWIFVILLFGLSTDLFSSGIKSDVKGDDGTRRITTYYEDLYKKADSQGRGSKGSFAISFQKNTSEEVKYVFIVMLKNEIHDYVAGSNLIFEGEGNQIVLTLNWDVLRNEVNSSGEMILHYDITEDQIKEIRKTNIEAVTFEISQQETLTVKVAHDFNGDFLDCDNEIKERLF